jgi:hypothetical protein
MVPTKVLPIFVDVAFHRAGGNFSKRFARRAHLVDRGL